ncbi:beta-ketoacyl-[acyl-carrier-protein] synthase family protein [Desulfosarcina ovata]|uniref:3-oxoacyl-[acyl-carrier-protein] synthase 2 n=1 Tax=Desulfosarcina ovata subsp. ovata TaxID=2752305 RepID=A0A5K8A9I4_9BACT|nr:beta-ketoacyl-[acyl-carrier-protein] synthase family protein [Desulfosarcina ovata]BBO88854.1 3-oxoacyl-[acyl-carrier-protein] synthase 2 [Desulfosarcina ovata subsp. ovata]
MSRTPAVIIGYDAVSPLGIDLEAQWRRALAGQSGIDALTRIRPGPDFPVQVAGQVASIDHLDYPFLKPREQARWISPLFKYALLTVQRALERAGLAIDADLAPRTAVTYSSAIGGLDAVLGADRRWIASRSLPLPCVNPNACINMVAGKVSMLTGATGPITTTITACATGLTSMITGAMLIAQDRADIVICGAVDFALVEPILAGFATMNGAYVPKENAPPEAPQTVSRPFSVNRRGFVVSEGAGCIVLAGKRFARERRLNADVEIAGWSMTSDAHHFVAPHYPTVRRCITESIKDAGIAADRIQAVNAHAASTRVGDQVEFDALRDIFGTHMPPVTANKSLIGHAMGASSAIESIFTFLGMQGGVLPPTINHQPDPQIPIDCVTEGSRPVAQEHVLKNAFGFGGCNACIVFRRI